MAKALDQLGLDRSEVDVEVVNEGRGGILGVGAQEARVIVTPRPGVVARGGGRPTAEAAAEDDEEYDDDELDDEEYEDDEEYDDDELDDEEESPAPVRAGGAPAGRYGQGTPPARPPRERERRPLPEPTADPNDPVAVAVEIVEHMLELMGVDASVTPREPETEGDGSVNAVLDIRGADLNALIGRRGETLASFQYLVNLMLNRRATVRGMVGLDIGGYRRRREESLRSLASRMAERVAGNGQSITLEPMPPNERRIIHLALADHPDVLTVSIGEGESRKVAITPRR